MIVKEYKKDSENSDQGWILVCTHVCMLLIDSTGCIELILGLFLIADGFELINIREHG